jgi:signal transduction histidine kinase
MANAGEFFQGPEAKEVLYMDRDVRFRRFALGTVEAPDLSHSMSFAELAQVVHDFQSPLSAVTLETQVLLNSLDDGAHVEMVNAITRVLLNLDYLDRLMQDLIDSCAIDAGKFELHRRLTNLSELLRAVAARMTPTCEPGRIVVETPRSGLGLGEKLVSLHVDPLRIERVVANFVQNALKYAPRATRVVVRLAPRDGAVRVSVIDVGPGIPRDDAQHLFAAYRRAPTEQPHEGSGLGLYVSKRIIEAHGGTIGVETVTGAGSEFFFELPLQ